MRVFAASLAFILFAQWSLPVTAQADSHLQMAPASPWTVDYAQESCALRRSFTAGPDQAILELRAFGPGNNFEVTVASGTISGSNSSVRTRFEPDDAFFAPSDAVFLSAGSLHAVRYTDSLKPAAVKGHSESEPLPVWPEPEREARERTVTALTIAGVAPKIMTLQTGPLDQPMVALRTCLDDLLKQWGLDPVVQRSLSRQAEAIDQMAWARRTQGGLPADIIRAGGSGRTHLRLIVGADGKPTMCVPLRTTGAPAFGEYACGVALKYACFEPALDAKGQPVGTVFSATVAYQTSKTRRE